MKPFRLVIFFLALAMLVPAAAGDAKPVTITVYSTGDLHDHSGNLAKIAGFIKKQKQSDPNVLFVDCGDFCNKGEARMAAARGEGMVHLMSLCGYDAVILGNHDYLYGKDRMLDLVNKHPKFPLMLFNMRWEDKDVERAKSIPKYKIYTLGGARVCLIGGGSHYRNHAHGPAFPMFHERDAYNEIYDEIREKSDIIVCLTHLYDGSDRNLVDNWKEKTPDVILGAHTHRATVRMQGSALLVKGTFWGRHLARVTLTWDGTKVVDKKGKIIEVRDDWPVDETVQKARDAYFAPKPAKDK